MGGVDRGEEERGLRGHGGGGERVRGQGQGVRKEGRERGRGGNGEGVRSCSLRDNTIIMESATDGEGAQVWGPSGK